MSDWNFSGIELDDDGYPTEESLAELKAQPLDFYSAARWIVNELPKANLYAQSETLAPSIARSHDAFTREPKTVVRYSTLGWSGNEDIIATATDRFDIAHFLVSWRKGGHFVFEVPDAITQPVRNGRRG